MLIKVAESTSYSELPNATLLPFATILWWQQGGTALKFALL
ncbi:hypothetical protein [aff. Roholtiella sp. LEGE 12411]|nr:hypothetical protein [aff. Roholtiella sp. LEGE 12411]